MVKPWPIDIDGLPNLKMLDLSMAMLVITRWYPTWLSNMVPKECPSIYGGVTGKIIDKNHLVMTNIAMERSTIFIGKASISIRAMANCECHNQRVNLHISIFSNR